MFVRHVVAIQCIAASRLTLKSTNMNNCCTSSV